jgi:hypothetical protein
MVNDTSDCGTRLGYEDFDPKRIVRSSPVQCPVHLCTMELAYVAYHKREIPWCRKHGIRLHSGTFVYWNGPGLQNESLLRNFIVRPDLVRTIALDSGVKAESYRLGYEMSEDALSWNVFVSLATAGKLRDAAEVLTGRSVSAEPSLYLWGERVDVKHGERTIYEPLLRVRKSLEDGIEHFLTEPDIILVAEGEMVISIEAKFGSGNPLAYDSATQAGKRPTSRADLLARYLGDKTSALTKHIVRPEYMGSILHSQLFRNIVFASEMAREVPWHVVNLVSSTQRGTKNSVRYSFADPEADVRSYLHADWQHCFTAGTWETLHAEVISGCTDLAELDRYLQTKSAHYIRAFDLDVAPQSANTSPNLAQHGTTD